MAARPAQSRSCCGVQPAGYAKNESVSFVLSGEVTLVVRDRDGVNEVKLGARGPGALIADVAYFDAEAMPCDAIGETSGVVADRGAYGGPDCQPPPRHRAPSPWATARAWRPRRAGQRPTSPEQPPGAPSEASWRAMLGALPHPGV